MERAVIAQPLPAAPHPMGFETQGCSVHSQTQGRAVPVSSNGAPGDKPSLEKAAGEAARSVCWEVWASHAVSEPPCPHLWGLSAVMNVKQFQWYLANGQCPKR